MRHIGDTDQSAVKAVGPPVIRATKRASIPPLLAVFDMPGAPISLHRRRDAHSPVLTHRRDHVDLLAAPASYDDLLPAGQCGGEEVALVGDLIQATDTQPTPVEHRGALELVEVGVGLGGRRERDGPVDMSSRSVERSQRNRATERSAHGCLRERCSACG